MTKNKPSSITIRNVARQAGVSVVTVSRYINQNAPKEIMAQIEMIFVNEAPFLSLFPGPDWYEYNTSKFIGSPTEEDNYAPGTPYTSPYAHMLMC